MDSSQIQTLWAAAVDDYASDTKRKGSDLDATVLGEINSAEDLISRIEAGDVAFRGWRTRHGKLLETLKAFVSPVAALVKISITPASVAGFGVPSTAVLGSVLYLVRACEGVSNAYDWIEQIFKELQEFAERLEVYVRTNLDDGLRKKITAILAFVLRVIGKSERLVKERRFREYLRVTFLGKDAETRKILDDLNQLFGSEQRFVLAVTYASTQRIEDGTKKIVEQSSEHVKFVMEIEKKKEDAKAMLEAQNILKQVLQTTSAADDVEETFVRNRRALLPGTGAWLQKEPIFASWMDQKATILWVFGGPGAGKSYLSTWIVKTLLEKDASLRGPVAYFFIKENSEILRDANVILKTLAAQLIDKDVEFRQHAVAVCSQRSSTVTADDTWENLFLAYYGNPQPGSVRKATMIVDGLDEATPSTRRTILGYMQELVGGRRAALHFAVVGRTSLRSDMNFTRLEKIYFIEVSKYKNRDDIDTYIRKRLEEVEILQVMRRLKPNGLKRANKTGALIRTKVLDGADGVFLWAKLLLDSVVKKDVAQIEGILTNPPQTLDEMIWSVFERLAKDDELDHEILKKMLLLMTYSRRPLIFGELDLVLSLPSRKPNFLLWKHTRGKLSSVFDLKYPQGFDADAEEAHSHEAFESHAEQDDEDSQDDGAFDFSGDGEDTGDDDESDSDDLFSPVLDRSIGSFDRLALDNSGKSAVQHLSPGQLRTQVAFCHARIRDYLVREGSPLTRTKPKLSIIPDAESAHVEMTIVCLQIFQSEVSPQSGSKYLIDYPLAHLAHHLERVDRSKVTLADRATIIEGLYWLFKTSKGTYAFVRSVGWVDEFHLDNHVLWQLWVGTTRYLQLVQAWFTDIKDVAKSASWDAEKVAWMISASESFGNLLHPLMIAASRYWLVKPGFDSDEYTDKGEWPCWLMHGWLTIAETGTVTPLMEDFNFTFQSHQQRLLETATRLIELASWAGLEQNADWYTCLGWQLMNGNFYPEALAHLQKAVDLDEGAWVAMEAIARSHSELQNYTEAISWQERAIAALPEPVKWISAYLWPRIVTWRQALNDLDKAFEAAVAGFDAMEYSLDAQQRMFEMYHIRGDSAAIVEKLQFLDNENGDTPGYSWLVRFFLHGNDAYNAIGKACRDQGLPQFVLEAMDRAVVEMSHDDLVQRLWLPYHVGNFKFTYYGLQADSAKLLELFLERLEQKDQQMQSYCLNERKFALNRLAVLYYDSLVAAATNENAGSQPDIPDAENKLKALAVVTSTGFSEYYDGFDFFRGDYPALLWGRWLRDYRGAEEAAWRKCFRSRLLEEMNTMYDDDPANDTQGLMSLAGTLFHAGDNTNAGAILAILFAIVEAQMATKEEEKKASEAVESAISETGLSDDFIGPQPNPNPNPVTNSQDMETSADKIWLNVDESAGHYLCDECEIDTSDAEELYFCEVCNNVNWCGPCLARLKDTTGSLPRMSEHSCNPNHRFYLAWPIPEEARYVAAESFEQGVTVRKQWLEKLRSEWWT